MSFEKPYYFVAMVFSPLWEGPKWLEVALDADFASIRLDADQSKRFALGPMQLSIANDQQKTWYLAWRDEQGKWAIGIHDTVLQKQLQRMPPPALASQLSGMSLSQEKKPTKPKFNFKIPLPTISSKSLSKIFFLFFVIGVLFLSFGDRLIRWASQSFIVLEMGTEIKLGEDIYRSLYKDLKVVQNPYLQEVLETTSRRLSRGSMYSYAWVIVQDERAFDIDILPGGIMLVPTGLLRRMDNMDELYGVMANRILLVEQRAVLPEVIAAAGWPAVWNLYRKQYPEAVKYMAPHVRGVAYTSRSQLLADRPAFIRLWMMNVDPKKWAGFLEREANWQKKDPVLSKVVYPVTLERINYIKDIDTRKPPTTTYLPSRFDWAEVKRNLPAVKKGEGALKAK